jgi:mono/diheme cytochrome c family protein
MAARPLAVLAALVLGLAGSGCDDHMANQPKRLPYELPYGAKAPWPALPPAGTVARDDRPVPKPAVSLALLQRGRERFDIYCAPCHSRLGDGDGRIARRGFPHPPSYHIDRLRKAPDRHFYDVMTNGYGVMYPYRDRVSPEDRWAIVAYIRALQLSQDAPPQALPANAGGSGGAR